MKTASQLLVLVGICAASARADAVYGFFFRSGEFDTVGAMAGPSVTCPVGDTDLCTSSLGLAYYNSISGVVYLSGGGDAVSWSFTDGVNTLNNSNSTGSFSLGIEPDGTVDGEFLVEENVPGVSISFYGSDAVGATDYTSMDGTYVEAEALTGNWYGPSIVVTSTPEPRNWLLVLFGIFVFAGRKRGQRSALHQRL